MRATSICVSGVAVALMLLAGCGGDADPALDAAENLSDCGCGDRPMETDAAAGLMGLGQPCVPSMQGADCPATAPGCLSFSPTGPGMCTAVCLSSATFTTDSQTQSGPLTPDPSTENGACAAIYEGSVGVPICALPVNRMPGGALQPDTTYTVAVVCGIQCGTGDICPAGFTCDTQRNLCKP